MAPLNALRPLARTYATAAVGTSKAAHVKVPVQVVGLPGTYAGAAFSAALAKGEKTLNGLAEDLTAIKSAVAKDQKLAQFLANPTLSSKDRNAGIADMLKVAKSGADGVTKNLFTTLGENGRLALSERVIDEFATIMSAHRGEVTVNVTTASDLDSSNKSRLEKALKESQAAKAGKTVKFIYKTNPAILGGINVDFGDKSIDLSVASRVGKLNNLLEQSV